ncbi:MAG TPA: hypothetical protein VN879_19740, partial [Candidatus Acidoferrales bacterium]|nr:hypothetical protein [Candidatus Acidoferrales bacterium]
MVARVTVGNGAVEFASEHVAFVVFEPTVPPFIVATTESPAADVNEGAVIVNVAVPEASVVAVPLWPESGPVIVRVTVVPATGSPFDETTAVLVMEEPRPHMTEESTGDST